VHDEHVPRSGIGIERVRQSPVLVGRERLRAALGIPRADHRDVGAGVEPRLHCSIAVRRRRIV